MTITLPTWVEGRPRAHGLSRSVLPGGLAASRLRGDFPTGARPRLPGPPRGGPSWCDFGFTAGERDPQRGRLSEAKPASPFSSGPASIRLGVSCGHPQSRGSAGWQNCPSTDTTRVTAKCLVGTVLEDPEGPHVHEPAALSPFIDYRPHRWGAGPTRISLGLGGRRFVG